MQSQQARDLLSRHRQAFSGDPSQPPLITPNLKHRIELTQHAPVKQRAYRQSPLKQEVVRSQVRKYQERGLIQPSSSEWSSPIVLVPKPHVTNQWRLCIDYRKLNALTKKDAYPMPLIEECLEVCKEADWFTILDIKDAYHHVEMDPDSIPLTAFVTPDGLFEWKRMPFGLATAPATFQRHVDQVLRAFIGKTAVAFFDDTNVYTTGSFEQHLKDVEAVLVALTAAKLEISAEKCHIGYKEVLFIGHIISKGKISPDPQKVKAIECYPAPTNLKELRSFLGLMNYYHKFIPGYAAIALPLYQLTRKDVPYEWSAACITAFHRLRTALLTYPCLRAADFSRPFILQTDASGTGLGAVLTQEHDGVEHPLAYISRQLNAAERNYSGTELECLAVVWAIGQFEHYLVDSPFTLVTDHSALQWLPQKKFENTRVMRWVMKLQEFTFNVRHRPGTANANADAISRQPTPDSAPDDHTLDDPAVGPFDVQPRYVRAAMAKDLPYPVLQDLGVVILDGASRRLRRCLKAQTQGGSAPEAAHSVHLVLVDEAQGQKLADAQRSDPPTKLLIDYLANHHLPASFTADESAALIHKALSYTLVIKPAPVGALLYYVPTTARRGLSALVPVTPRVVVPPSLRPALMHLFHDSPFGGHFGIKRTLRKVAGNYYWDTLPKDVAAYVSTCTDCAREKTMRRSPQYPAGMMTPPSEPFELISMDFIGPFKKSEDFEYVLVIIDHFTRWAIAVPTLNQSAESVAEVLMNEVYTKYGVPRRLLSDRGSAFVSTLQQQLNTKLGINALYSSPYHPQSNGMVERLNGTLKEIISTLRSRHGDQWVQTLQAAVFAYNTSKSEATGYTPYYALYGREAVTPGDQLAASLTDGDDTAPHLDTYVQELVANTTDCHAFIKKIFDQKKADLATKREGFTRIPVYEVGDSVWIKDPAIGSSGKAVGHRTPWIGPGTVKRKITELVYEVEYPVRILRRSKIRMQIVPVNVHRMKLARTRDGTHESIEEADAVPDPPTEVVPMEVDAPPAASSTSSPPARPPAPTTFDDQHPPPADRPIPPMRLRTPTHTPVYDDHYMTRRPTLEQQRRLSLPRRPDSSHR